MIGDAVAEVAQTSLKHISRRQTHLTNRITTHVNKITEAINQVKGAVEFEMHGSNLIDTFETSLIFPSLKVELVAQVLKTRTPKFDDTSHELGTLSLEFSKMAMN